MTPKPQLDELDHQLRAARHSADVRAVLLATIRRLEQGSAEGEWGALLDRAVQALHAISSADPTAAGEAILRDLLPLCLAKDWSDHRRQSEYRRYCVEWTNELPDKTRSEVRAALIAIAAAALTTPQVENALGLVSVLGYADSAILSVLETMVASGNAPLGDQALAVLTQLMPVPVRAPAFRAELHSRMRHRWNSALVNVARAVGNPETLDVVFDLWLTTGRVGALSDSEPWLFEFTLGLAATISGRYLADDLPTRTWQRLLTVPGGPSESVVGVIERTGALGSRFATPAVISALVHWANAAEGLRRYSLYTQLAECARPEQLPGWDDVATADLNEIWRDALAANTQKGQWVTINYRQKMEAWQVLLSCGRPETVPSFDDALEAEGNGYVCSELLDLVACVPPSRLPGRVRALLAGRPEHSEWTDNEYMSAHVAAIRAAHGAGSREAFDALFAFRSPTAGVLITLVHALADVAALLASRGDNEPTERLFQAAAGVGEDHTREAAGGAIGNLLLRGLLTDENAIRAIRLGVSPDLDPFSRRDLLYAIARRPEVVCPADILEAIRLVAFGRRQLSATETRAGLRRAAIAVLSSRVTADSEPEIASECLSLVVGDSGYRFTGEIATVGQIVYALGLQFERSPARFTEVVARIIREAFPASVAQLVPAIRRVGAGLPEGVRAALRDRVRKMDGGRSFEPAVLQVLLEVSPSTLLADVGEAIDQWMPQARAALAEFLELISSHDESLATKRFDLLARLAGDGLYAVRRCAYRALAAVEPDRFAALLSSWAAISDAKGEGLRRRAAEGSGWLPDPPSEEPIKSLAWDKEESVREAYTRASSERDERRVSGQYEAKVLAVSDVGSVMRTWRYGVALGRVGDDRTVDRLKSDLHKDRLPSVRFWFERIRKALEKRWDETTRKWPEPWVIRRGFVEPFEGVVRTASRQETVVRGFMWRTTPELPNSYASWGGWGEGTMFDMIGEQALLVPGRTPAQIIVTNSNLPAGPLFFTGNGPYPDEVRSEAS